MKYAITIVTCFIFNLLNLSTHSAENTIASGYIFNSITIEQGLPVNFIDDMYKDSKGFLWISTQGGGLSRYDGYEFVRFNVDSYPVALKSNFIRKSCEDNFNRLWVASDCGIDLIDLKTMQASNVSYKGNSVHHLFEEPIASVFKDSTGNIWILSDDKIYKIVFNHSGFIDHLYTLTNDSNSQDFSFTALSEINNEIWAAHKGIIYKLAVSNAGQLELRPISDILNFGADRNISVILKKEEVIWIGSDIGLYKFNLNNKELKLYSHSESNPFSLSQNMVTDLAVTDEGVLAVGTLRGLNFYHPSTDQFEWISHSKDATSLNSDFINCITSDGNNLWVGTEAGGINKMTLRRLAISNYSHNKRDKSSISANPVNAIYEDHKGDLWVGTVEGGLNRKPRNENFFIHYTYEEGLLNHNSVSALTEDRNGNLWIGTWGGGLNILNLNKLPNANFKHFIPRVNNNNQVYISALVYDSINNGVWIGSSTDIAFFDIQSNQIVDPFSSQLSKNKRNVLGTLIDDKSNLWIGTSDGIILIDLKTFNSTNPKCSSKYLELKEESLNKLFLKNITCIYQSRDKTVWIGSKGYGFCSLKYKEGKYVCEVYTTANGLSNNMALGVLEDELGLIWISTGYGLSCYNPQNNRIVNYTKSDGLIEHQFYWNASYKSPTNKNLYFGNISGLSELKNGSQYLESKQKKVIFTKLQILNKSIWSGNGNYIDQDISYANKLHLHEQDKSFSIEFSALDYDNPTTVSYSYRLAGFDDKWIDVPADRRFASYTNLQPGTYTFQVRCMSRASALAGDITELEIEVRPFFYKTGWFIGLVLFLLVFLFIQFYRWRINMLKKQKEVLHKKVVERTQKLEDQAIELKSQNNILVEQNEKISEQRLQLIKMSNKVQEALDDKMNFFTNITHEFRTPITLITGPIERALKLSSNPQVIEQLQFVEHNSKHLLSLVNQLMDVQKIESEQLSIKLVSDNFLNFLNEILIPFEVFANERGIRLEKIYRLNSPRILFDEEAMHKVVTNLLSNAIKFTPDNGIIKLYVASLKKAGTNQLYICVNDSGIGLKEDDLLRIFDRFYQSKEHIKYPIAGQSGTGIGLYLCQSIVSLLKGTIYAKNNHKKGASFRVLLPIEQVETVDETENNYNYPTVKETEKIELETTNNPCNKLTILVVEDNADMREYIRSILSDYYKVLEAENGMEALNTLKKQSVHFIISDLMMPVMDGLELSEKVKADLTISHIPFLMLTAKTSKETQISSYKLGVDEYLLKPFDEDILLTRIGNILETKKTYQRKFSVFMNIEELNIAEESNDEKFLNKAIEIIKANYKNPYYEVTDFIESMGVSKSLMNKKIQTITGQSAGQFIRNYRLNLARELILKNYINKNKSIADIAYEVGFNDPKYFTRCFTKHFGMPPSNLFKDG
ncbi:signal transduction histidine kinase [Dysgonomonas alginatilytica]|uniref:histidine kinase n=1 Tax=Dysgonomonas alginatilytica TaxID=1605892 RepID=A0A2V3PL78_9BACT|nr:two-component regulator propeller domain-containing protein [Dysgonomonas alginatilytica]PXV60194.1 signal transduction histidine kinase [Dysgonomonas alginatilytica]